MELLAIIMYSKESKRLMEIKQNSYFGEKELWNMQDVKMEYIGEQAIITVDGEQIAVATDEKAKLVAENLLVSLDRVGAIDLTIEV